MTTFFSQNRLFLLGLLLSSFCVAGTHTVVAAEPSSQIDATKVKAYTTVQLQQAEDNQKQKIQELQNAQKQYTSELQNTNAIVNANVNSSLKNTTETSPSPTTLSVAKTLVQKALDTILASLQSARVKVATTQGIDASSQKKFLAQLDQEIIWYTTQRDAVENDNAVALRSRATAVKERWNGSRQKAKRVLGLLQVEKMNALIDKLAALQTKTASAVATLQEQSSVPSAITSIQRSYTTSVAGLQKQMDQAETLFQTSDDASFDGAYDKGVKLLQKSTTQIKSANSQVTALIQALRAVAQQS